MSSSVSHSHTTALPATLDKIVQDLRASRKPFPVILDEFTAWGLSHYILDLSNRKALYYDDKGNIYEDNTSLPVVSVSGHFDASAVHAAIKDRMAGKLRYDEFLNKCAQAGADKLEVTTQPRRGKITGKTPGQETTSEIPTTNKP